MFINSITHSFYNLKLNKKISQYYPSINNNSICHESFSSSSLSSVSSSLFNQSRNTFKKITVGNPCKIIDSLSSLSTTSLSSSITIILHSLHTRKKQRQKIHHRKKLFKYQNNSNTKSSSSSLSLPPLEKRKQSLQNKNIKKQESILFERNGLNTNRLSSSPSLYDKKVDHRIFSESKMFDKTTSFFHKNSLSSKSINDLNDIIQDETDDEKNIENFNYQQTHALTVATQTDDRKEMIDNHSYIRQQYQYGSLRRVNSDLLDYIFIPTYQTVKLEE